MNMYSMILWDCAATEYMTVWDCAVPEGRTL